ncbi:hypothetical protein Tco_0063758, partial [Tanacetum coccineum]
FELDDEGAVDDNNAIVIIVNIYLDDLSKLGFFFLML